MSLYNMAVLTLIFGEIILHGPHHVAKKSMTISLSSSFINLWKSTCKYKRNTAFNKFHCTIL